MATCLLAALLCPAPHPSGFGPDPTFSLLCTQSKFSFLAFVFEAGVVLGDFPTSCETSGVLKYIICSGSILEPGQS